ncbi:hypothetical protein BU24DRAFT_423266 [Aaosphaeria arxii CBS 175.79]|uniref:Uncharacterized protein n=1 Tax=Aaosphaeria arxii CBS 175.79 TaxID=1450172 RepID=A0A6A5XMW7_9PLEO|nr:uncharacterized protein BU24DRAFT_423266 [Aaosphaeria arxii CBS 175.79]KAF2014256.1 hypothetical protein BU24DRAFT_423266 [Aaosphaeria arxii CBS 175.79]
MKPFKAFNPEIDLIRESSSHISLSFGCFEMPSIKRVEPILSAIRKANATSHSIGI